MDDIVLRPCRGRRADGTPCPTDTDDPDRLCFECRQKADTKGGADSDR